MPKAKTEEAEQDRRRKIAKASVEHWQNVQY